MKKWYCVETIYNGMSCISSEIHCTVEADKKPESENSEYHEDGYLYEVYDEYFETEEEANKHIEWALSPLGII